MGKISNQKEVRKQQKIQKMKAVIQGVKNYIRAVQYFFTPHYKSRSYNLHFYYSIVIAIPVVLFGLYYINLIDTPLWFHFVFGGATLFAVNFLREWYRGLMFKIGEDFNDIYFGSYGGIVGAGIAEIIVFLWDIM